MDTVNEEIKQLKEEITQLKAQNVKLNERITEIENVIRNCAPNSAVSKIEDDNKKTKKENKEKEDKKARDELFKLKGVLG